MAMLRPFYSGPIVTGSHVILFAAPSAMAPIAIAVPRLMPKSKFVSTLRAAFDGRLCQNLAILFCVLYGLAIIVNVELAGNPMWFWYAVLFHHGAKLYADMHLALQPLFVLEMDLWMQAFGTKVLALESLSLLHAIALCLGIQLLVRESAWPDWQKGIALAGTFIVCTYFNAYLFNDFHVLTDVFWVFSLVLLLWVAKANAEARQIGLGLALGVLSGLTVTLRITDGAALFAGVGICLLIFARTRKLVVAGLFVAAAALTSIAVVGVTGDSFKDYLSNSIFKAAASKGGGHSLLADPFLLFVNAVKALHRGGKWMLLWVFLMVAVGAVLQRYKKSGARSIVLVQLGVAALGFAIAGSALRGQLLMGALIGELSIFTIVLIYLLAPTIAVRYTMWRTADGRREWDAREVLVVPLFLWMAAASGSSAGTPQNFFEMLALLLVLAIVIQPFRRQAVWANASVVTIFLLMGVTGAIGKVRVPYSWHNYIYSSMFRDREWYRHPVYGLMYIQRDELQFYLPICKELELGSNGTPELLSLPYPQVNYFCSTPPWHGYVQTFFDTSTRSTVMELIKELQTSPPQWIVYQRQLDNLAAHERIYNHGQPLAQRDLDELIMRKIATGQWQMVDKINYLEGDGWLVIRTRP